MAVATPYASASLYVGDLAREVTEALLFEVFSGVGPVASVRVCRDATTRHSLGYAYVNFHRVEDAERALDTMNFKPIRSIPCRIMWSHRDPSLRKSGVGNIFVKNLAPTIDNKTLYDTFSFVGNILSCKVALDANGKSLGYGFVHYESEESATEAVEQINGKVIAEQKVIVQPFKSKKERGDNNSSVYTNIYVKGIPEDATPESFKELFAKYGEITSSKLVMAEGEDEKQVPKGFGFVCFNKPEEAAAAVEALDGHEWSGKKLFVARAQKRDEREKQLRERFEQLKVERQKKYEGVNLYVKNLGDDIDEERLTKEFEQFGTISSVKIMTEESGKSKGFGFVCFATAEEAQKAVDKMKNHMIDGKPLYVSHAQRKDVRRAQLEAQHAAGRSKMGGVPPHPQMYAPQGAPMFYAPGMPPRNFAMYPQHMMPRRWNGQPQPNGAPPQMMVNNGPRNYQLMPVPNARGPNPNQQQRQGRNNRRNNGMQQGKQQNQQGMPRQMGQQGRYQGRDQPQEEAAPAVEASDNTTFIKNLASVPPEQQKQQLGEVLYPLIQKDERVDGSRVGKITGMLLEMDNTEIISLLDNTEALGEKISEAVAVLDAAGPGLE